MAQLEVTNLNAVLSVLQRRCKFMLLNAYFKEALLLEGGTLFLRDADGWHIRDSD